MNQEKLALSLRLFTMRIVYAHSEKIVINDDSIFLFADIIINKNGNFYIILDKELKTEKLIIHIKSLEHITSTLFFEYNQNNYKNIDINLYTKEYAQLSFNFFIQKIKQITQKISAYPHENANISVFGSYFATDNQTRNLETYQYHTKKNSSSNVTLHGVCLGNSKIIHLGYLEIAKDAKKTKAHQTSKHITLSKNAKVYAKPVLNVLNNDVQCSHGSAIGQITDEQLFYFFARGICKKSAIKLLLESFIHHNFPSYDVAKII